MQTIRSWTIILTALMPMTLGACTSLFQESASGAAGIAGAGIAGAVSRNAVVGAGIGIGVAALADVGVQYEERRLHNTEQSNIAAAAGALRVGQVGTWTVSHDIPLAPDEHGELVVAREIGGIGFSCREIVFSVYGGSAEKPGPARTDSIKPDDPGFYTATVCKDGSLWKWATAEPSTERWGGLQ